VFLSAERIMVGKNLLLACLVLVVAFSMGGCALTATEFDDVAGWSDGAMQDRAPSPYENAALASDETRHSAPEVVTIRNERGGYVVDYAARMMKLEESNTPVRFAGRCDSACTLYLALPQDQTCIAHGASFRFHAPSASSRFARQAAETYMLNTYPEWVTRWLEAQGGLSPRVITMDYSYASQYLRPCEEAL
jgi:hypothetical protein